MKILVCTSMTPFHSGGAELLAEHVSSLLRQHGHKVELLALPFESKWDRVLDQILAFRLLDLEGHADRVIALRFPSYFVRHPHKVIWFIHHYRAVYDLWGTVYSDVPTTPEALAVRAAIRKADGVALREAVRVYANSHVVARRLSEYNKISAQVLYPSLPDSEHYKSLGYGDYLLYVARFTSHKRQRLAVQAMRHTATPVRLVLAGRIDPGAEGYVAQLRQMISSAGLDQRVMLLDMGISENEKLALLSGCLGALYIAHDEDSYGFFSLEAHHARKALLVTSDSGGCTELVIDGINGRVVAPDPQALAEAMDELYRNPQTAQKLGEAGAGRIEELGISSERVVRSLLQ